MESPNEWPKIYLSLNVNTIIWLNTELYDQRCKTFFAAGHVTALGCQSTLRLPPTHQTNKQPCKLIILQSLATCLLSYFLHRIGYAWSRNVTRDPGLIWLFVLEALRGWSKRLTGKSESIIYQLVLNILIIIGDFSEVTFLVKM